MQTKEKNKEVPVSELCGRIIGKGVTKHVVFDKNILVDNLRQRTVRNSVDKIWTTTMRSVVMHTVNRKDV